MTTSLSPDGVFWVQLSLDDPGYDAMADELRLKLSESRDIMTPVFFNTGDLCAGIFSEDDSWYRARIISAREGMVCRHCMPYLASSPGHSHVFNVTPPFLHVILKIWEWPGDKAMPYHYVVHVPLILNRHIHVYDIIVHQLSLVD